MNDYSIAPIRENQIAEAQALMSRCFESKLASIFYLYPESTLVATYQGSVVAGINLDVYTVNKKVKMGYIGWLYTDENHRGKALAGRLLDEAIIFLRKNGCTSLSACVEGDNPASFKQLATRGFSILGLKDQIQLFRVGTAKVYHHASRFFDMGYFLWHKSLTEQSFKKAPEGLQALLFTLLGNTLLFFFCLKGWNLLNLLGFHPFTLTFSSFTPYQKLLLLISPSLFLLARTGGMLLLAKSQKIQEHLEIYKKSKHTITYRGWDTAWILAIALTFTVGFPFPVPGNLYIKGFTWNLKNEQQRLARMAIAGQVSVIVACLFVPKGIGLVFALPLVTLDALFFFYPFCGFNASRIKRMGTKTYGLYLAIVLAVMLVLLVY